MRIRRLSDGYALWLSANDTFLWANRPGNRWPASFLADHRLYIGVDSNGLCAFEMDGKPAIPDSNELKAIIADHLPDDLRKYWPTGSE